MRMFSPGRGLHRSPTLLLGTIGNIAERIKTNRNMDRFNSAVRGAARESACAVQENGLADMQQERA